MSSWHTELLQQLTGNVVQRQWCNTGAASHAKICGVVSTSTTALQPAYQSAPGWDFTTGLGSINATNLVNAMATHLVFTTEPNASYAPGAAISVQVSIE